MEENPLKEILAIVRAHEADLRAALARGRAGLLRHKDGRIEVRAHMPFGARWDDVEVLYVFATPDDLEMFFRFAAD